MASIYGKTKTAEAVKTIHASAVPQKSKMILWIMLCLLNQTVPSFL